MTKIIHSRRGREKWEEETKTERFPGRTGGQWEKKEEVIRKRK